MKLYLYIASVAFATLIPVSIWTAVTFSRLTEWTDKLQVENVRLKQDLTVYAFERKILTANRYLDPAVSLSIAVAIPACAELSDLDPWLLFATMKRESNFNPRAIGAGLERGLMQIRKSTAAEIGLAWGEAFDVTANTCAGASYLAHHVRERGVHAGLLRYNGGGEPRYPALVLANYPTQTGGL